MINRTESTTKIWQKKRSTFMPDYKLIVQNDSEQPIAILLDSKNSLLKADYKQVIASGNSKSITLPSGANIWRLGIVNLQTLSLFKYMVVQLLLDGGVLPKMTIKQIDLKAGEL